MSWRHAARSAPTRRALLIELLTVIGAYLAGSVLARSAYATRISVTASRRAARPPQSELFHIVQADKLRVYVNVPETYARRSGRTPDTAMQLGG